jgi:hypothetical protein
MKHLQGGLLGEAPRVVSVASVTRTVLRSTWTASGPSVAKSPCPKRPGCSI